jgi:GAF domain-containing protein
MGRLARQAGPRRRHLADARSRPVRAQTRCEMAAPMLLADGHLLGVLALSRDAAGAYGPADMDGLVRLADVAARVLRRLWDLRHLREKARQLETLIATGQALVGKLEQRQLFDTLTRDATAMMQAKACALYLLDPGSGDLRLASYRGAPGTLAPEGDLPLRLCLAASAVKDPQAGLVRRHPVARVPRPPRPAPGPRAARR